MSVEISNEQYQKMMNLEGELKEAHRCNKVLVSGIDIAIEFVDNQTAEKLRDVLRDAKGDIMLFDASN